MTARLRAPQVALGMLRALGITNGAVAEAAGLSPVQVSRVLHGHRPASPRFRQAVAHLVGVTEQELFPQEHDS